MKLHKFAKLFPLVTGDDFKALVLDIKKNGLRHPITTLDGQILDGQNRQSACIAAGVEPIYVEFSGGDPLEFVISQNMNRRHLTDDQRAAIAAEIAKAKQGGDRGQAAELAVSKSEPTIAQAAAVMKVSPRRVQRAKALKKESPAAFKKVKAGEMSLNAAHEQKHPRKPKPEPSPLRGVDTAKMDAPEPEAEWLEPEAPEAAPAVPLPNPVLPPKITEPVEAKLPETMTPKQFEAALKVLETRAESAAAGNQKEREKYGVIVNALAGRLLNPVKKEFNPYTS
jgi:hypothetical protein